MEQLWISCIYYLLCFIVKEKRDHAVKSSDNDLKIKMGHFILTTLCVALSSCNFVRFKKQTNKHIK